MKILFLGRANHPESAYSLDFLEKNLAGDIKFFKGDRHSPFPIKESDTMEEFDLILSFVNPWIVPAWLLMRSKLSINFHPGPPEYPGIGCTNFAIYNEEKEFGVTCHHMVPKVDRGDIISVTRFPLYAGDTVYDLTQRCYANLLIQFKDIIRCILRGDKLLPIMHWARVPYTRAELDALCEITSLMNATEVKRRVRAVTYPNMPGAYTMVGGVKFNAEVK